MTAYFIPRRMGHANLYVYDYERIYDFYNHVIGYNQAYVQPQKRAIFLTNGNTYHDLALMEGLPFDPINQRRSGLNHIAFELETEKDLVDGWRLAIKDGYKFEATINHDAAHSVYLKDCDGNIVELYADVVDDWRQIRTGVVTKKKPVWIPGVSSEPLTKSLYPKNPDIVHLESSLFGAKQVTHVTLIVKNWDEQLRFYTEFVGLKVVAQARDNSWVTLKGEASTHWDLVLVRAIDDSESIGLKHVGIEVHQPKKLRIVNDKPMDSLLKWSDAKYRRLNGFREVVCLLDPGSVGLQLYCNIEMQKLEIEDFTREDALFFL